MDKFSSFLSDNFDVTITEGFEKRASYYDAMDFLEYVSLDETVVADRVDNFLTVLWNAEQTEVIGFRCKGFGYVFGEFVKPAMKLNDDDFNPIKFALEMIFTKAGEIIFDGVRIDDERRQSAYTESLALIRRDNVTLPVELAAAA